MQAAVARKVWMLDRGRPSSLTLRGEGPGWCSPHLGPARPSVSIHTVASLVVARRRMAPSNSRVTASAGAAPGAAGVVRGGRRERSLMGTIVEDRSG